MIEKSIDKKVEDILIRELSKYVDWKVGVSGELIDCVEEIMLKIRPFLKVKKKWIGDAL